MEVYSWMIGNREILKIIFTLLIVFICTIIVLKTNKFFKLTDHQGIRYFRNAFFFYGLAFVARYILSAYYFLKSNSIITHASLILIRIVYEFLLIMACLFLFYSLSWKKFEIKHSLSSLFNIQISIFYLLALIISLLDFIWNGYYFMLFFQIIVFSFAGGLAFEKYEPRSSKRFLRLYLLVILLSLVTRILNFIIPSFFEWNRAGVIGVYTLDAVIFTLFLYGIIKVTK